MDNSEKGVILENCKTFSQTRELRPTHPQTNVSSKILKYKYTISSYSEIRCGSERVTWKGRLTRHFFLDFHDLGPRNGPHQHPLLPIGVDGQFVKTFLFQSLPDGGSRKTEGKASQLGPKTGLGVGEGAKGRRGKKKTSYTDVRCKT